MAAHPPYLIAARDIGGFLSTAEAAVCAHQSSLYPATVGCALVLTVDASVMKPAAEDSDNFITMARMRADRSQLLAQSWTTVATGYAQVGVSS